jgi:hypothetical protein
MKPKHPWWARLGVGISMLILAFIGIVVTDLHHSGGWEYWKWTVPLYAVMALWLSWYERRTRDTVSPITIWHEMLHWFGLFAVIVLIEVYVHMGLLSRSVASLVALTLLSLTIFTVGIYIESTFLLIGVILGIFAAVVAIAIKFLYAFTIPALIIGIGAMSFMIWNSHRKTNHPPS